MNRTNKRSRVFSCAEVREFDRRAIEELQIPGIILMENAGRVLTEELCCFMEKNCISGPILILAGPGNNGGDGFVMARQLQRLSYQVKVAAIGTPGSWKGDAAINLRALEKLTDSNLTLFYFDKNNFVPSMDQLNGYLCEAGIVIDAILGTGAHGAPRFPIGEIIDTANGSSKPFFAVDIPSGLDGDSGKPAKPTIRAQMTCTLAALKKGLTEKSAAEYVGELILGDIGVAVTKLVSDTAAE